MAASKSPIDRLYQNAKDSGIDRLGGRRAYEIAGPTIRRMAVADAILTLPAIQDESVAAETVRTLLNGLYDRLTSDTDFYA